MKMMTLRQYEIAAEYSDYLKNHPTITPARREIDGIWYTWIDDVSGQSKGFWLSDPQSLDPESLRPKDISTAEVRDRILSGMKPMMSEAEFIRPTKDDADNY